jgi:hypothetical protein
MNEVVMKVMIGSKAAEVWGMNRLPPQDTDIWSDVVIPERKGWDVHIHSTELLNLIPTKNGIALPDALYTIKCSHLGWNIKWEKTKQDILWFKLKHNCQLIPELYEALLDVWNTEHGDKSFLSLNKDKEAFFQDAVTYIYEHDYLHQLVAHPNPPVYTKCLKDGQDVLIDKEKFDKMEFEDKVRMFREEITTIAIERWMVNPYWKGKVSWYQAHMLSLQKTITNLTKGWATSFIVLNLEHFVKPDYSYFKHSIETLEELNMSKKVDLEFFENIAETSGGSVEYVVFSMCEGDWDSDYCNGLEYEHLEQDGGGEGNGEYCYGVFQLGDTIYRAEYSYASYAGYDYDDIISTLKVVTPKKKTITVYE